MAARSQARSRFTSFVAHVGGPPFQVYALPIRLDPKVLSGTAAIFFAATNALKLVPYFALGQFDTANLTASAVLMPLAPLSTMAGAWLVRRMRPEIFYPFTYATVAVVAPPDPDGPNMFRCAAPGYVGALYETAGLRDVAEWDVNVELVTRSPEQYWDMISEHVSLAVAALQQVDEPARERIRATAIAKVSAFEKDGKVRVPGVARCIVGTKE